MEDRCFSFYFYLALSYHTTGIYLYMRSTALEIRFTRVTEEAGAEFTFSTSLLPDVAVRMSATDDSTCIWRPPL